MMTNLKPNAAFLASQLLQTTPGLKWTIDFFTAAQARVVSGVTDESEEVEIFRDHMMDSFSKGLWRPHDPASIDWKTLFYHIKTYLKISDESVKLEIRGTENHRLQVHQGFLPKPLIDILAPQEIDEYVEELREHEFGRTFHRYRLEDILDFIDWLDRNRGPFDEKVLPNMLKEFISVKSGETLARIWLQTIHRRYPDGIKWEHKIH